MATKQRRGTREERDREDRDFEARFRFKLRVLDGVVSLIRTALRGSILLTALYIAAVGAAPFAGRSTAVVALVKAMADFKADRYFFAVTVVLVGGAWWQERRKRTKLITEWGSYIKELEAKIDPDGAPSGLLNTGRPKKEDADAL